jgi:hypothetical protein
MQKRYLLKLSQQSGEGRIKERGEGVNSNITYLIHCTNIVNATTAPSPRTTMEK